MQQNVRSLLPDMMNTFSESFGDLKVVMLTVFEGQIPYGQYLDCRKNKLVWI
jgi:hypothetical protein